jgi:hypothetical protein
VGRHGRTTGSYGRHDQLRKPSHLRHSANRLCGRVHQAAREGRQRGCRIGVGFDSTHADNPSASADRAYPAIIDFDKSIIKYPNITRYVGGASTDLVPDLQHPNDPVPLLKDQIERLHIGGGAAD